MRALLGGALAAGACGLPSADEYSRGAPVAPSDGGSDGGGGTVPGGQDGAADREAGTECAGGALFCDDFEGNPVEAKWETRDDSGGDLVAGEGVTGRGLAVNLRDRDGTKEVTANLETPVVIPRQTAFTVSFDLKMSETNGQGIIDLDCFRFHTPYFIFGFRMADYDPRVIVHWYGDPIGDDGEIYTEKPVEVQKPRTWTRVACSVTFGPASVQAKVTFDGVEAFASSIPMGGYASERLYLLAGVGNTERAGAAVTLSFDRYVLTTP
ncbi:MAG: hypothetical protein U0270_21885 [Labilithrix sp.]